MGLVSGSWGFCLLAPQDLGAVGYFPPSPLLTPVMAGIDVQAELRAKTNSPNLGPTHMPQNLVQPPPMHRALLNRHHSRRSNSSIAPKLEPGVSPLPPPILTHPSAVSPKSRPTPSSHSASPTATTSFGSQHGTSPASSDQMANSMRPILPPASAMKAPPTAPAGRRHGRSRCPATVADA